MEGLTSERLILTLALIGGVILITALLSGLIERSRAPQVAVFLALGAMVGTFGLGIATVTLQSPILYVVATLSLVLVLFTDALGLDLIDARRHAGLAAVVLGPGTLLSAAIVTAAAWWLLRLPLAGCAILGAALASTDPVLLRGLVRNTKLPAEVRQALRLESGLNDVVLLPIVLIAARFLMPSEAHDTGWIGMVVRMLLLGPGAGVAVGLAAVAALDLVRRRVGVRRDYESLYSLGVAFLAYAGAEALHGSGFLAAFAAGLTIVALDVELCDCFLEYGETTAEMLLLFTFVLLGSSLIWGGFDVLDWRSAAFVVIALVARVVAFFPSLAITSLPSRSRGLIAWFGPRGLSSLLLLLLPVFAGVPGSEHLFAVGCLVVLASVVVHGGTITWLMRRLGPGGPAPALALAPAGPRAMPSPTLPTIDLPGPEGSIRVTLEEVLRKEDAGERVEFLDVRTDRSRRKAGVDLANTVRIPPDDAVAAVERLGLAKDLRLTCFCA